MFDGYTNSVEWLKVYHLSIMLVGENSSIMENYLPSWFGFSTWKWLFGLLAKSINSWEELTL
jgi:hypothetical protein